MSKTTPEEAEKLAAKYGIYTEFGTRLGGLAALIGEVRRVDAEPFMHVYEFASPFGGTVWRDSPDMWNGNKPKRSLPLYTHPAPSKPAAPVGYKLVMVPDEAAPDEPDWEECKRQAEVSTGLKIEQNTFSILKREVRRWIAHKAAPVELPVVMYWVDGSPLVKLADAQAAIAEKAS